MIEDGGTGGGGDGGGVGCDDGEGPIFKTTFG
jgi:hypothetical protein